jgi:hypothetical protein
MLRPITVAWMVSCFPVAESVTVAVDSTTVMNTSVGELADYRDSLSSANL